MECGFPFIRLFMTPENFYLYDVNKNSILRIEKEVYDILSKADSTEINGLIENKSTSIGRLVEKGFLSAKRIKKIVHPSDEVLQYYLKSKLHMLTLQVTQQCNFRCRYCPYSGSYSNRRHDDKVMSYDTAKKGIDFLIRHSYDRNTLNVGFYGGEPLLEFELIKKCIEYAEEKTCGKRIKFDITTNGSIINEKIIEYLKLHKVYLMISLDGPKEIHDKNRKYTNGNCGTFDKVMGNIELIVNKYPEYLDFLSFNAVIDPENDFNCTNNFFLTFKQLNRIRQNAAPLRDDNIGADMVVPEDFMLKRNYEMLKLFLYLLGRIDKKHISQLMLGEYTFMKKKHDQLIQTEALPDSYHHGGPCIPGVQRLFMNIYGDLYPCERVSETTDMMKIGHIDEGFFTEKLSKLLNIGGLTEDECKNCWAVRYCTLCAAYADDAGDFSARKKLSNCDWVRRSVEEQFKNYCTLKEFGHDFNEIDLLDNIV